MVVGVPGIMSPFTSGTVSLASFSDPLVVMTFDGTVDTTSFLVISISAAVAASRGAAAPAIGGLVCSLERGGIRAGTDSGFWFAVREAGCASSSAVALLRQQRKTVNKRPIPPGFRVRPPDLTLSEPPSPSFLLRFRLLLVDALSLIAGAAVRAVEVGDGSDIFVDDVRPGTANAAPLWAIAEESEATSVVEVDRGRFDGFGTESSPDMALGAMGAWMEAVRGG